MTEDKAIAIAKDFRLLCKKHDLEEVVLTTNPEFLYETPYKTTFKLSRSFMKGYDGHIEIEISYPSRRFLTTA